MKGYWDSGEYGSHGRSTLGEETEMRESTFSADDAVLDLLRISRKLLSQSQRRGILQMGPSNLDDILEFLCLFIQGSMQLFQARDEMLRDLHDGGNVHDGGKRVIGGLRHVYMVIWMDGILGAQFATQEGDGAVGDDFVDVHVELGA
jgi:hypothetical protein